MMYGRSCGSLALGVLLLSIPGDTPEFAPGAGTQLSKRFTTHMTFELEDAEASLEGEIPFLPDLSMSGEFSKIIAIVDDYREVEGGRPLDMQREYGDLLYALDMELVYNLDGAEGTTEGTGSSSLEGDKVRFQWDEDSEEWERSFIGEHTADEDALAGLSEDMDLRTLLPGEEIEEGDSWDIDTTAFLNLLRPAGQVDVELEMEPLDYAYELQILGLHPASIASLSFLHDKPSQGAVEATLKSIQGAGDERIAVIALAFEIEVETDIAEAVTEMLGDDPTGTGAVLELDAAPMTFEFEGEGELLWDLGAGHLAGLTFEGDYILILEKEITAILPGEPSISAETMVEFAGRIEHKIEIE